MSARLVALALGTSIIAVAANAQEAVPLPVGETAPADEIIVFGRLSSDDIFDIPQSVDVLGGDVIQDTRSETLGDALRLVPGVSRDGSVYDVFGDSFLIRGFPANQTVNGMTANALRQARDTVSISRIEVLKGPASVLYGQLQPGAVVNVVTKQPERIFAAQASASFGQFDNWRTTLDLTGPITPGGSVRFRVAAAYDDADSIIDYWHREHFVLAPSLAFDLGTATTVTVEGLYARNELNGFLNGLPAEGTVLPNPNGALPETLGLADPTFDPSVRENKEVTARIDHRFSDHLKARAGLSWTREDTDEEGVFGLLGWDEEFRTLTRAVLTSRSKGDAWTAYADLGATLWTGPVRHEVVIGVDHSWLDRDNLSEVGLASSLDVYSPQYELEQKPETFPVSSLGSASVERNRSLGVFAQDRIALTEQLRVIGGLRWSRYRQRTATTLGTGESFEEAQSQTAWTSQIGVLFNPVHTMSLFANDKRTSMRKSSNNR